MRVSIERMLSNASSGCAARTSFRSVSANASGRWLVRATTKTLCHRHDRRKAGKPPPALRLRELRLFYRADNADNGEELSLRSDLVATKDLLAERAPVGPITPRKIFVHHADAFRAVRIRRGQEPPFAQRNAERREVIAVDAVGIMTVHGLTRRRHIALRCDRGFAVIPAQRNVRDRSGGGDSRLLPDGFQQAIDNTDCGPRVTVATEMVHSPART